MSKLSDGRRGPLSEDGKSTFGRESIERRLHHLGEFRVATTHDDVVVSGVGTVPRRPVDRLTQFDGDLRGKWPCRNPTRNHTKGRPENERHHLDSEHPVDTEKLRDTFSPREYDDRLVRAYRNGGDYGNLRSQGNTNEPEAVSKGDAVPLRPGPKGLVVTTWEIDQDPSPSKDRLRFGYARLDGAGSGHHRANTREPQEEGVEQCEDRFVLASFAPPRRQQHRKVWRRLAARMVPDDEEGPARRQPLEPPHLRPEVARETLEDRSSGAKETRVTIGSDGAHHATAARRPWRRSAIPASTSDCRDVVVNRTCGEEPHVTARVPAHFGIAPVCCQSLHLRGADETVGPARPRSASAASRQAVGARARM